MQITINTSELLGDETTIREEVIAQVSNALTTSMRAQARESLAEMLEEHLSEAVALAVSEAVAMTMDTEFTDVNPYGRAGKAASLRDRIADFVQAECTLKKTNYASDRSAFTSAVLDVVAGEVGKFKKEFNSLVTRQVVEQSMDMAVAKLREAMGIKAATN